MQEQETTLWALAGNEGIFSSGRVNLQLGITYHRPWGQLPMSCCSWGQSTTEQAAQGRKRQELRQPQGNPHRSALHPGLQRQGRQDWHSLVSALSFGETLVPFCYLFLYWNHLLLLRAPALLLLGAESAEQDRHPGDTAWESSMTSQ